MMKVLSKSTGLATKVIIISLFSLAISVFAVSGVYAITENVPDSSWMDANQGNFAFLGYDSSGGGMPGAGTPTGWSAYFDINNPPSFWSQGEVPGAYANLPSIKDCVTGDITVTLDYNYEQKIDTSGSQSGNNSMILDSNVNVYESFDSGINNTQSGSVHMEHVFSNADYRSKSLAFWISMGTVEGSEWKISNRLGNVTYDDSACPVPLATDPDISTTPSSTPVTINILGNDTGTNLNVSKIDNQTITSGDTITLTNGSGTVKLNTDGTITFTPNSTFSGESIFSYSITDGASTVDTGVVRITVAAATTTNTTTTTTTTTTTPSTPTASAASTNSTKVLAKTGDNLKAITTVATLVLGLAGYTKFKNNIKRARSYRIR